MCQAVRFVACHGWIGPVVQLHRMAAHNPKLGARGFAALRPLKHRAKAKPQYAEATPGSAHGTVRLPRSYP